MINKRRYNKLLSYRNNYYADGGPGLGGFNPSSLGELTPSPNYSSPEYLKEMSSAIKVNPMPVKQGLLNTIKSGALNGAATAVGGMVGSAIGGGLSSGAGNVIGSLGNIASAIPGPWGAIAGAGLKVIGGLTNRAFGSKLNDENIKAVKGDINRLASFQSDASNFDALNDTWGTTALGADFSNSYIGKDGWFSSKAKNKAKELREKMRLANAFAENTLQNNADNITENTMNNLEANYAAFGGLLHQYADGGSIDINPNNRGKFNATKKRTGKTTEELTHSKNPLTRKRAIFAQNAAKWHSFGGDLNTNGADFPTGLTFINEGGTHESNPYEGVPMGVDSEGKPNLVEEGEAIYNDYVFSNRLTVPKATRSKYGLKGGNTLTFADAVKQLSKPASERPNDPISQETLRDIMADLSQLQEGIRIAKEGGQQYAHGGNLNNKFDGTGNMSNNLKLGRSPESLRYAPTVGLGLATLADTIGLTNKPNYEEANNIEATARGGSYMPVTWNPIGNRLTYRPFDRDYYINKLNAESGATRRAIANQSGGNSGRAIAGLLASDYNSQSQLGDLFRKSEEYNLEQRQKVEDFNRATNQVNSQGQLQADMANQQAYASARDYSLRGTMAAAEMRQKDRLAAEAAKSANLSGFLSSLGDIGYENKSMNMIRALAEAGLVPLSEPMVDLYSTRSAKKKAKNSTLTSNKRK